MSPANVESWINGPRGAEKTGAGWGGAAVVVLPADGPLGETNGRPEMNARVATHFDLGSWPAASYSRPPV